MKALRLLLALIGISAKSGLVVAQVILPVISNPTVTNGEFRFTISATTASNCIIQSATNNGGGSLFWQALGPASNSFSTPVLHDQVPHHFRLRCEEGGTLYSVNLATYCYVQPPTGFSMLGYPLESIGNTLSNLLPNVSEGTLLHWFNPASQQLETAQFQFGRWSHPEVQIPRGRAVMLWSPPQASPFVLCGTSSTPVHTNRLTTSFNLLSPAWPYSAGPPSDPFCNVRSALELIGTDGIDPVYRPYEELSPDWYDEQFNVHPPPFPPFGGLWIYRPCPAATWIESRTPWSETAPANNPDGEALPKSAGNGFVYFNNYVPGFGINARIVHTNGDVPSGSNWLAQLYAGAPGDAEIDLIATGEPLPFLSGGEAGYIDTTAGVTRILTNAADAGDSLGQIRYWDVRTGPSYGSATLKGKTPVFLMPTRLAPTTPAPPMLGLMSPRLTISRCMLPAAHLVVQGYSGMSYSIEASGSLTNWTAIALVTNATSTSTFIETGSNTNQHRFYRATIRGPSL